MRRFADRLVQPSFDIVTRSKGREGDQQLPLGVRLLVPHGERLERTVQPSVMLVSGVDPRNFSGLALAVRIEGAFAGPDDGGA